MGPLVGGDQDGHVIGTSLHLKFIYCKMWKLKHLVKEVRIGTGRLVTFFFFLVLRKLRSGGITRLN